MPLARPRIQLRAGVACSITALSAWNQRPCERNIHAWAPPLYHAILPGGTFVSTGYHYLLKILRPRITDG